MKRILITGGSGFIGTNLMQHYLELGCDVVNIDIKSPRNKDHDKYWHPTDICNERALIKEIIEFNPDYIFHLAARTDLQGQILDEYMANTKGTSNVIEGAKSCASIKRIIFASSMLVCKLGYKPKDEGDYNPTTLYGESKVINEEIIRREAGDKLDWVIVRPTSIWGPWFDVPYRNYFDAIRKGIYLHPKGMVVKRSYGYVQNTVFQLERLASCSRGLVNSKTFYLADYEPIELRMWGEMIRMYFGARKIQEVPMWLLKVGAKVGDIMKNICTFNPPLTTFRLNNMCTNAVYDIEELKSVCGDLPYTAADGVKTTVKWIKQQPEN